MLVDTGREPAGKDAGRERPELPDGAKELGRARLVLPDVPLHLLDASELPDRHGESLAQVEGLVVGRGILPQPLEIDSSRPEIASKPLQIQKKSREIDFAPS